MFTTHPKGKRPPKSILKKIAQAHPLARCLDDALQELVSEDSSQRKLQNNDQLDSNSNKAEKKSYRVITKNKSCETHEDNLDVLSNVNFSNPDQDQLGRAQKNIGYDLGHHDDDQLGRAQKNISNDLDRFHSSEKVGFHLDDSLRKKLLEVYTNAVAETFWDIDNLHSKTSKANKKKKPSKVIMANHLQK